MNFNCVSSWKGKCLLNVKYCSKEMIALYRSVKPRVTLSGRTSQREGTGVILGAQKVLNYSLVTS